MRSRIAGIRSMIARFGWLLGAVMLIAIAGFGGSLCVFGWEAVATGANRLGWVSLFVAGVLCPLSASGWCLYKAGRATQS